MPDDLNALRHIEGLPTGEDADILALSDPPHYTAYPNPHIGEFIEKWGKPYDEATDDYHREPYVADVSEGKEALVAGFTEAYRAGRYADILTVGRKLPKRLLEDSPDIYDFVDIAEAKVEG